MSNINALPSDCIVEYTLEQIDERDERMGDLGHYFSEKIEPILREKLTDGCWDTCLVTQHDEASLVNQKHLQFCRKFTGTYVEDGHVTGKMIVTVRCDDQGVFHSEIILNREDEFLTQKIILSADKERLETQLEEAVSYMEGLGLSEPLMDEKLVEYEQVENMLYTFNETYIEPILRSFIERDQRELLKKKSNHIMVEKKTLERDFDGSFSLPLHQRVCLKFTLVSDLQIIAGASYDVTIRPDENDLSTARVCINGSVVDHHKFEKALENINTLLRNKPCTTLKC